MSSRVLIVSPEAPGENMSGPAMRYWHLAQVLAGDFSVTLAAPGAPALTSTSAPVIRTRTTRMSRLTVLPPCCVRNSPCRGRGIGRRQRHSRSLRGGPVPRPSRRPARHRPATWSASTTRRSTSSERRSACTSESSRGESAPGSGRRRRSGVTEGWRALARHPSRRPARVLA